MSQYAEIGNKIMDVLANFDGLNDLAHKDEDIAFFAKMDLTVALTKAVAEVKEKQDNPLVAIPKEQPIPDNKYFLSTTHGGLYVANETSIFCKEKGSSEWLDVSKVWDNWEELYDCGDIIYLTWPDYISRLAGNKTAPNDIPF